MRERIPLLICYLRGKLKVNIFSQTFSGSHTGRPGSKEILQTLTIFAQRLFRFLHNLDILPAENHARPDSQHGLVKRSFQFFRRVLHHLDTLLAENHARPDSQHNLVQRRPVFYTPDDKKNHARREPSAYMLPSGFLLPYTR